MLKFRFIIPQIFLIIPLAALWGSPAGNNNKVSLINHSQTRDCLVLSTNEGHIRMAAVTPNSIVISFCRDSIFSDPSDALIAHPGSQPLIIQEQDSRIMTRMGQNQVTIQKKPFEISLRTGSQHQETILIHGSMQNGNSTGVSIQLQPGEKITGGGSRAIPMDRRGYQLRLNNEPHWGYAWGAENLNYSVPVFVSDRPYLIFFDAPQRATADIGYSDENIFRLESNKENFTVYIVTGNDHKETLKEYTLLTGTQPLPPFWALGHLQSRFGYTSQEHAINVADSTIMAGFPLDAMIMDLYWFGKGIGDFRMGNLTWEAENWPQPQKMIDHFLDNGVKTILITEPFFLTDSDHYDEMAQKGYFGKDSTGNAFVIDDFWFGPASLIDVFNPDAMEWFWSKHVPHIEKGIAGWWGDLGEPEKHPAGIYYKAGSSDEIHNIYGHYWSKMLHDKYREHYPDQRLFFLNRAGYAGSQRYSVFPWSGDVSRCWNGFRAQLPIMLGMSMSGIPYMHSDLGGFAAGEKDDELYTRWMQFGVFNPVYRPHGESIPSEPIYFSDDAQDVIREFIKLRYELLPYLYTMSWQQTTKGTPLARPLFYEHPDKSEFFDIYDTYYWGDNLLVAPVLEPGITSRDVTLPEGYWIHLFNNQIYSGGQTISVETPFENIPVFVKAGSFITKAKPVMSTEYFSTDTLLVSYYHHPKTENGHGQMFMDDGENPTSIENGEYELVSYQATNTGRQLKIEVNCNKGNYYGKPEQRHYNVIIHNLEKEPRRVNINGRRSDFSFDEKRSKLIIPFNRQREKIEIVIRK
ncbi:TIM-barrel domain-containing protein [Alkalitalea saponilacus]|uniref:Oligosaccharide 4-alpha-D-glucosyltransferase n=1 Tax=Alkalitalea saponilacus TaxID=889453 RepID=A0A1T5BFK0_9BACT|nr:TIM-barrel domain-containing protein [Alkalitalea saponilacus]ASB49699.1 hypothetical protein CDL62_11400 [Alkalitalea saponilacus]SKB46074.1 oligosaccharide 4-alpha-D-glucosyltransferase [Alkalitalea saponilacus]